MFGYVKVCESELLVREYELYKAIYCGTCRSMKKCTGTLSRIFLSYDYVFLALVRMVLDKENGRDIKIERHRCIAHPMKKRNMAVHKEIDASARAAAVMNYLKVKDDIADSGFLKRIVRYSVLPIAARAKKKANEEELLEGASADIDELSMAQRREEKSVDLVADIFGRLLSRAFGCGLDGEKKTVAEDIGYALGKIIYELDAFDDYEKDVVSGNYNPYICLCGKDGLFGYADSIKTAITLEMTVLEEKISRLDFDGADAAEHLIKNVLYLGLSNELTRICSKYEKPDKSGKKEKTRDEESL